VALQPTVVDRTPVSIPRSREAEETAVSRGDLMNGRRTTAIAFAGTLVMSAVPAVAATTDGIVLDAKDGRIDGLYDRASLETAQSSPLLKTYGGANGVAAVKSALGAQTVSARNSGDLPFTGAEMVTFGALGSTLLVAGFILRRQPRKPGDHS
jgi:hypothetical protein